jgi:PHP family Zn ribbon phosphoesterase
MVLNPDLVEQQYQKYLAGKQAQQQVNLAAEQLKQKEKAEKDAFYANLHKRHEIVTTRKEHPCEHCGHTIVKGAKARARTVTTGYGWPEGEHRTTYYTHVECLGAVEA